MTGAIKRIQRNLQEDLIYKVLSSTIRKKDFTVFSNECWGGELYKKLKIPYSTPFVGMTLMAPCYIKFLKNPQKYIEGDLHYIPNSRYPHVNDLMKKIGKSPIARIDDIEAIFKHYESEEEAREKWNRIKARIN